MGGAAVRDGGLRHENVRALGELAVLDVGVLVGTAAANAAAFLPDLPGPGRSVGAILAIVVNIGVLTASYRVLIRSSLGWRVFLPGGVVGGEYVARVVVDASDIYGAFALMSGLLMWIALLARVTPPCQ